MADNDNQNNDGYKENEFKNAEGYKIFYRTWTAVNKTKGVAFIAHGAGEHGGWYDKIARELNKHDVVAVAQDHYGHGKSGGDRMDLLSFEIYIRDQWQLIDKVVEELHLQELPIFLIGHSMGGTIAIESANKKPDKIKGVVLLGPAVIVDGAPGWQVSICTGVSKVFPNLPIKALDPKMISRNKEVVDGYINDPLIYHGSLKARFLSAFLSRLQELVTRLDKVTWPFLIIHGDQDKMCALTGSQQLYDKASSSDKTLKIFPGAYHQVHNELPEVATETLRLTTDWISSRL